MRLNFTCPNIMPATLYRQREIAKPEASNVVDIAPRADDFDLFLHLARRLRLRDAPLNGL
jgi:hypothetical protein